MSKPNIACIKKKGLFRSLLLGILLAVGGGFTISALTTAAPSSDSTATEAATSQLSPSARSVDGTLASHGYDVDNEEEVNSAEFGITVSSSTITEQSQTFTTTFRSKVVAAFNNGARYRNVFLEVVDSSYTSSADVQSTADAQKVACEESGEAYEMPVYEAYVLNIVGRSSSKDIIIPEYVNYYPITVNGEDTFGCSLHVVGIRTEATLNWDTGEIDNSNIESISIPSSIEYVEEGAFVTTDESGNTYDILVEDSEEEVSYNEGWIDGWVDDTSKVTYGSTYDHESTRATPTSSGTSNYGDGVTFVIGDYLTLSEEDAATAGVDVNEYYQPLVLEYDIYNEDGTIESQGNLRELSLQTTNSYYDAVGSNALSLTLSMNIDFDLAEGTYIPGESLVFHNIYYYTRTTIGTVNYRIPDYSQSAMYCHPTLNYSDPVSLDSIFSQTPAGVSTFGSYTLISSVFDTNTEVYAELKPSSYRNYSSYIASGAYRIRTLLYSLNNASYRICYRGEGDEVKTVTYSVSTPRNYDQVEISDGETFGFLLTNDEIGSDFSADRLISFELVGFTVRMDLYNVDRNSIITNSNTSMRFASVCFLNTETDAHFDFSGLLTLTLTYIIYTVVFVGAAVGYYIYSKEKYKNDEFRRVDTKAYVKTSVKNFVGCGLVVSAILFIVLRWGFLNSSITTYNPLDLWVILTTIAAAIFIGITIKNTIGMIKEIRERREKARLKLDQDVVEDGTK